MKGRYNMCWSGEASAILAGIGIGTTIYATRKGEPMPLCMTLGYFSSMELLQAFTYMVINECDNPTNQILTLLGYLHITFQPFFINYLSMYFIPETVRNRIVVPVYTLCFVSAIVMILIMYPFEWAGKCQIGTQLCGKHLCSVSGNWHIAWELPLNGLVHMFQQFTGNGYNTYILCYLLVPILYGSWRMTLYHFLVGPILAGLLTDNPNEIPAVWCLLSIGILLLVVKTPLRKIMHVKTWPLWPKAWTRVPQRQPVS